MRIADLALLLRDAGTGLNMVVGYAGLLDLGLRGVLPWAPMFALMASPHLPETFEGFAAMFPNGLVHTSIWLVIPLAALLAACTGYCLGIPVLKLRGDCTWPSSHGLHGEIHPASS